MSLRSLCHLSARSLVLLILPCIPRCFHLLHDGTMNFSSGLNNAPWHHSSSTGRFCINDVTAFVILFFIFELSSLVLWNKLHFSLLIHDYVCDLSYKSNVLVVWLETFHKVYLEWKILLHQYIWLCNYFIQYNIHPYLTKNCVDAFHLH